MKQSQDQLIAVQILQTLLAARIADSGSLEKVALTEVPSALRFLMMKQFGERRRGKNSESEKEKWRESRRSELSTGTVECEECLISQLNLTTRTIRNSGRKEAWSK